MNDSVSNLMFFKLIQPWIGNLYNSHIRLCCTECKGICFSFGIGYAIKNRRFSNIGYAYNSTLKSHLCSGLIDSGANLSLFRGFKKLPPISPIWGTLNILRKYKPPIWGVGG